MGGDCRVVYRISADAQYQGFKSIQNHFPPCLKPNLRTMPMPKTGPQKLDLWIKKNPRRAKWIDVFYNTCNPANNPCVASPTCVQLLSPQIMNWPIDLERQACTHNKKNAADQTVGGT